MNTLNSIVLNRYTKILFYKRVSLKHVLFFILQFFFIKKFRLIHNCLIINLFEWLWVTLNLYWMILKWWLESMVYSTWCWTSIFGEVSSSLTSYCLLVSDALRSTSIVCIWRPSSYFLWNCQTNLENINENLHAKLVPVIPIHITFSSYFFHVTYHFSWPM